MTLTLDELIARAEISDLIHRYAFNVRTGNAADDAALFAAAGTFEIRETDTTDLTTARTRTLLSGRAAIQEYLQLTARQEIKLCPLISNLLIEIDGDMASSSCVMTNHIWPGGGQMIGEYRDMFRRASAWQFTSRIYTIFGTAAAGG